MLIDILRHGEPVGGARYRGTTDDVLSKDGWQQMDAVVHQTSHQTMPWTDIISSPLRRCADFATQLCKTQQLTLHIEPRFSEIDFGDWEGMTSQQIMENDSGRLSEYWKNPSLVTPPNGESLDDFRSRVVTAWRDLIDKYFHINNANEHLLIVTHGGTLRVILSELLQIPTTALFNIDVPYSCLSRLQYQDRDCHPQLIFHNGQIP